MAAHRSHEEAHEEGQMKFRQAREIAEDVAVKILEGVDTERVKALISDTVYKEHGPDELVQKMVFDQFQQIIERMRRHARGPVFKGVGRR